MDRREFLIGTAAVAGASATVVIPEIANAKPLPEAKEEVFSIGDSECCVDWRWPNGEPKWVMTSRDGVRWFHDGPLNNEGRKLILEHFGLDYIVMPENKQLQYMSPALLVAWRRAIEKKYDLSYAKIGESSRGGCHIAPELCA